MLVIYTEYINEGEFFLLKAVSVAFVAKKLWENIEKLIQFGLHLMPVAALSS